MQNSDYENQLFDESFYGPGRHEEPEAFGVEGEHSLFSDTEETKLTAEMLEVTNEAELQQFLQRLVAGGAGEAKRLPVFRYLEPLLRQVAVQTLPSVFQNAQGASLGTRNATAGSLADAAGGLFGLELEGLSREDQEFEAARQFVRFGTATVRHGRRLPASIPPRAAARRAFHAAARRYAPGLHRGFGMRRPGYRGEPTTDAASPFPIAVTCDCHCGSPAAEESSAAGQAAPSPLPDSQPANSTDSKTLTSEEIHMHDLDRTTMEVTDETEAFESEEFQEFEGSGDGLFNEDEEAEMAAGLLEINDEAELDQFIGSFLKKARSYLGGALKSPLLGPLGGYLKGAIKKALPIAGGALGNLVAPGVGGALGSQLASKGSSMLGFEMEGIATEDQEFEVAKQIVRMAATAAQEAAQSPAATVDPQGAAKTAMISAARAHLPGLLEGQAKSKGGGCHCHRPGGRWYRRGQQIILVGA